MGFLNEQRGLYVADSEFKYYSEGAYGLVFVDRAKGRILKVYRARQPLPHSTEVFNAEVEAYKIAMKSDDLKKLVPEFFGARTGLIIMDKDGTDVTNEFYPNLAFEAEFVPGEFRKISFAPESEQKQVMELFRSHGINHAIDASITLEGEKIRKLIDFAIRENVPRVESLEEGDE